MALLLVSRNEEPEARFLTWWKLAHEDAVGRGDLPLFLDSLTQSAAGFVLPEGPLLQELLSWASSLPGWGPLEEPAPRPLLVRQLSAQEEEDLLQVSPTDPYTGQPQPGQEEAHQRSLHFRRESAQTLGHPLKTPKPEAARNTPASFLGSKTPSREDDAIQVLVVAREEKVFDKWKENVRRLLVNPKFFPELPELRQFLGALLEGGGFGVTLGAAAGLTQVMMQIPGWDAAEAQGTLPLSFFPKDPARTHEIGTALGAMLHKAWSAKDQASALVRRELRGQNKRSNQKKKKRRGERSGPFALYFV